MTKTSDLATFTRDEIRRAGELLGVPLDEASALRALIIQRDTGLSITRGEISIIQMGGKPTVFVNKQGYLAYASKQPEYDGYEYRVEAREGDMYAWCKVYRTDRSRPTYEDAWLSEDGQRTPIWAKMPKRMLAKVAIKRAHQAAFPLLNGMYDPAEAWDASAQIVGDEIVPPAPAPKMLAERTQPATYSLDQAQKIHANYVAHGFAVDVFDRAKITDDEYDKVMIDADFRRQLAKQAGKKEPENAPKTEDTLPC